MKKVIGFLVLTLLGFNNVYGIGFDHDDFGIDSFEYVYENNTLNLSINSTNDFGEYLFKVYLISDESKVYKVVENSEYFNYDENILNFSLDVNGLNLLEHDLLFEAYYNDELIYSNDTLVSIDVSSNDVIIKSVNFSSFYSLEDLGYYKELIFEVDYAGNGDLTIEYDLVNEFGDYAGRFNSSVDENGIIIINGNLIFESEIDGRYFLNNIKFYDDNDKYIVSYYNSSMSEDASYFEFNDWGFGPIVDTEVEIEEVEKIKESRGGSGGGSERSKEIGAEIEVVKENVSVEKETKEEVNFEDENKNEVQIVSENTSNQTGDTNISIDEGIDYENGLELRTIGSALVGIALIIGIMLMIPK